MFYHYPSLSSHSTRHAHSPSSLLGINNPLVYVFEPTAEDSVSRAIESPKEAPALAGKSDDDNRMIASIRGTNVYIEDAKDKYAISLDVPGVKIQDVKLQVKDSVLHVVAERKMRGNTVAKLAQHFALDESLIDPAHLTASLTDGVLTISAPKKEEPKPLEIVVAQSEPLSTEEDGLFLTLDVPGIKAADLKIEYHKGNLSIAGERIKLSAQSKRQVVSKVNRQFVIKEKLVDTNKIQAYLTDGVLTLTAPPKPTLPAKQIEIPTSVGVDGDTTTTTKDTETEKAEPATDVEPIVVETVTQDDEQ